MHTGTLINKLDAMVGRAEEHALVPVGVSRNMPPPQNREKAILSAYSILDEAYEMADKDEGRFLLVGAKLHLAYQLETLGVSHV